MRQFLNRAIEAVEYAPWLTRERLARWGAVYIALSIGLFVIDATAHPTSGITSGRDFSIFWSNTALAAAGRPDAVYAAWGHHSLDRSLTYPPIMLLLLWPLAALPYHAALMVWLVLGAALFGWALARLVGWPMAALATMAVPAAFWNLMSGQDGYITAALLGSGLTLVAWRPVGAGVLIGTLCYKPQFGILLPIALAAGGYWRTFAAAAAWVAVLIVASAVLFGPDAWIAFFHRMDLQRRLMELAVSSWTRMPSVFAMMRLAGAGLGAAYAAQLLSAVAASVAIGALWRRRCPLGVKAAGLAVAVFLATPHAWDYDTLVLVFAAAWLANAAAETGFLPWEKIAVLALLTLPALSLGPAKLLHLQIAPILLWPTMALILRRALAPVSRESQPVASREPVSKPA
jgi:alpha-1,2-mannosyltransferase